MKVLALSPHTDDVELRCGGYLTKLHEQGHKIDVVVFSDCSKYWGDLPLEEECRAALEHINANVAVLGFEMRGFHRQKILDVMMSLPVADLVLIPSAHDIHQDHQVVHNEAVRAFSRECNVLSYELAWNCRGFKPNYYVELHQKHVNGKLKMLSCYQSQIKLHRPYFDPELIRGLARNRGLQIKKEFAESFEVITWIYPDM